MGSCLTKNEVSEMSNRQLIHFLNNHERGRYMKYAKEVYEHGIDGGALVLLLDEREIELFLLDMGVYDIRDRMKLSHILQAFTTNDGSMVTLDSDALKMIPSTVELRLKGENATSLKSKGYTASELIEGGFSLFEVLKCGYTNKELRDTGYITNKKMTCVIDDEEVDGVYNGLCKNECAHGEGACQYSNGDSYEGYWMDNQRQGEGRESKSSGTIYQGSWVRGVKHGRGILTTYPSENSNETKAKAKDQTGTYIGEFCCNDRHGKGKYTSSAGWVYEGEFAFDKIEGEGMMSYANGDRYEGMFQEFQRCGEGVLKYADGMTYTGRFLMDKRWGPGVLTGERGVIYDGQYKSDLMHGFGSIYIFII
mmetsp:Transcript_30937/g.57676  ORF Transcript_30937/g.57676 Transcript_30937/m.57676 type:complete len:365 (+) Transcript_30937:235-1329(+)